MRQHVSLLICTELFSGLTPLFAPCVHTLSSLVSKSLPEYGIDSENYRKPTGSSFPDFIVKHNIKQTALTITITVERIIQSFGPLLVISISDNGNGFIEEVLAKGFGTGVGMKNLQLRMKQLPQGRILLSNTTATENTQDSNGATVRLEMAL